MSAKKKKKASARGNLIAIRLTDDELQRIDRLAESFAALVPGQTANRSGAVRAACIRGLDLYEQEARRTRGGE